MNSVAEVLLICQHFEVLQIGRHSILLQADHWLLVAACWV